jgi:glycerophosphoryl diester phosphodiesterase
MKIISHRGNLNGKNVELENNPTYILKAISMGFDVEIDLRVKDNQLFLGHDAPQYKIDKSFLEDNKEFLWIHCKEIDSLNKIKNIPGLNYFSHDKDDFVLTSLNFVWAMKYVDYLDAIKVDLDATTCRPDQFGICTDFAESLMHNIISDSMVEL